MLFAGQQVKNAIEVSNMAQGRRPSAILKTKSTVFLKTDRHNVFIFFSMVWRCFLLINTSFSITGTKTTLAWPLVVGKRAMRG